MNALTRIEPNAELTAWIDEGRALYAEGREIKWKQADWLVTGLEKFGGQFGFDFLAEALGTSPKALRDTYTVAKAYPPYRRVVALSFDHHEAVKTLPAIEGLVILQQAEREHWTAETTRIEAMRVKAIIEPPLIRDDPAHDALMAITRAWNRAAPNVRQEFMELAQESDLGVIDA